MQLKLREFAKSKNLILKRISLQITLEKTELINLFTNGLPDSLKRKDSEAKWE